MHTRLATAADAPELARLLADYLRESFPDHPGTGADQLRDEVLADPRAPRFVVAGRDGRLSGFMSWQPSFDVHWGAWGAVVGDLYVEPRSRGHGIALSLVAAVCSFARAQGAIFLRGHSYDRGSATGRFYERIAVGMDSAECHCGGRAFRHLADLHGAPAKVLARSLPRREWNYQP